MNELFGALTLMFAAFAFVIVIVAMNLRFRRRTFEHKERMAAIERGMAPADANAPTAATSRTFLLRGMIWLFAGIGLTVALIGVHYTTHSRTSMEERVVLERRLRMEGANEDQVRRADQELAERGQMPFGFAFLGLVPIGVGFALLLYSGYASSELQGRQQATPVGSRK